MKKSPKLSSLIDKAVFDYHLIEKGDRILIGTDKVGHWETYPAEVVKYYTLLDRLKPETVKKITSENALLLVKAR